MSRSVAYFALFDAARGQGIARKIDGFLNAAASEGWRTGSVVLHQKGLRGHMALGRAISHSSADVIMVRSTAHHLAAILPFCMIARFRRQVVLDVPTPHGSAFLEIIRSRLPWHTRLRMALLLAISGPFVFWPFHRIVEYAPEPRWWMLGNRQRFRIVGNGVNLQDTPPRRATPPWPSQALRLLAVANVSFWHGYDRMIRAIAEYARTPGARRVEFTIVGNGEELPFLQALAAELGVADRVTFLPPREGEALYGLYEDHHVAVGSLGLHRKGLHSAAELKSREYCAVGIPFITSGTDTDFDGTADFRFTVSQSERSDDGVEVLRQIVGRPTLPRATDIRQYAERRLDMRQKVREMIGDAS